MNNKRICTHPRRQARINRALERQQRMNRETAVGNDPTARAAQRGYTHTPRSER